MPTSISINEVDALKLQFGANGSAVISDTSAHSGNWLIIQVLEDCKFHTLTDSLRVSYEASDKKLADTTSSNCITLISGTYLYGKFSDVQLHSGSVIVYEKD